MTQVWEPESFLDAPSISKLPSGKLLLVFQEMKQVRPPCREQLTVPAASGPLRAVSLQEGAAGLRVNQQRRRAHVGG